ncbi:MAG: hypothetical protein ACU0CI_08250, partial [Shimia sp.]
MAQSHQGTPEPTQAAMEYDSLVRMVNRYQTIIDASLARIEGGEIDALSTAGKPYKDLVSLSKQLMEATDE